MAGAGIAGVRREARDADYAPSLSYHRDAGPRPGPQALTIAVGGCSVRLEGLTSGHSVALERRHGAFVRRGGSADLVVAMSRADRDGFLRIGSDPRGELYRVDLSTEGDAVLAASYEWAGWFDEAAGQGGLAMTGPALDDPAAFDRSLENFLRVVYAHTILSRGGFLLHAAGLVRGGRAYLFFGPSGAGKTTVTSLTPEATILSDDLTMVVPMPGGCFGACSVPFRGLFAPLAVSAGVWPLAGLYRLVQDRRDDLVPLTGAAAVGEVVASLPFVTETTRAACAAIDGAAAVARRVPVGKLHFRKDRAFWDVIRPDPAGIAEEARW